MFGLGAVMPLGWAALIVAACTSSAPRSSRMTGKKAFSQIHPKPERTIRTLKEDAEWARHPSS
jgi:hypothetical protein